MPEQDVMGFLNVNKAGGMTSHDVVARLRRGLNIRKIGHAGTLDPLAEGVLVICLGGAARLSEYVMQSVKRYRARVCLGVTTDTYDAEGQIIAQRDSGHIRQEMVEAALAGFMGDIQQIPPMYSAIKQGGRKLYDLARAGEVVEREARAVRIEALRLLEWSPPQFTLDVTCSAGTYIRSLAYDLGEALGVGAHLAALTRTASGHFTLEEAVSLERLLSDEDWRRYVVSPRAALADRAWLLVDDEAIRHIVQGRAVHGDDVRPGMLVFAYDAQERLIAILRGDDGRWHPHKVFWKSE